ncbi:tRNA (cytosine(38)-C(5))-methyltransferase-like isoform X2 [Crassostrea virginica]
MRILELYSGIGGMHCAVRESGISHEIIAAIDVNTTANKIYRHNFPGTNLMDCGIESLSAKQLDEMKIDMIVMSPPCQPFTRVGKKLDKEDIRTKSFLHLLSLFPRLNNCPKYILVENVKGFEESKTCLKLQETLQKCNFSYQEFLLTPLQFGIPNSRLRYYLIARRGPLEFCFETTSEIMTSLPHGLSRNENLHHQQSTDCKGNEAPGGNCHFENKADFFPSDQSKVTQNGMTGQCPSLSDSAIPSNTQENSPTLSYTCPICRTACLQTAGHNMRQLTEGDSGDNCSCLPVKDFLEDQPPEYFQSFMLTKKDLKRFIVMDIVFPCLQKTTCFTKRYGHFMEGAGSIFQMSQNISDMTAASALKDRTLELKNRDQWSEEDYQVLSRLQLRYFTPREIANFLCFQATYSFPEDLSRVQLYRTLGNSLNVRVVSCLIRLMVRDPERQD